MAERQKPQRSPSRLFLGHPGSMKEMELGQKLETLDVVLDVNLGVSDLLSAKTQRVNTVSFEPCGLC